MRQLVRCTTLTIPKKLKIDVRLSVDDRVVPQYTSVREATKTTILTLYPTVSVQILRPNEMDENGQFKRAAWNPNDSIGMTKYNYPIFVSNLVGIQQDMKTPNLYTYQGKRLELNEEAAAKIRRVFNVATTTIEFSAVVISQPDVDGIDSRMEGIKIKFNNENSSVTLTLNELDSLAFNLQHLDIDSLGMLMYLNFMNKPDHPRSFDTSGTSAPKPDVDIEPLKKTFASTDDDIDSIAM